MEELQDAIEDAQYVNAIATQEEGPRPVLAWEIPTEEQLSVWESTIKTARVSDDPEPFGLVWTLSSAIGLFLFSAFLKENCEDYLRINFAEEVIRWRKMRGKHRMERARKILEVYLKELPIDDVTGEKVFPEKTEIDEYDLIRHPPDLLGMSESEFEELCTMTLDDTKSKNCLGLKGPILKEVSQTILFMEQAIMALSRRSTPQVGSSKIVEESPKESGDGQDAGTDRTKQKQTATSMKLLTQSLKKKESSSLPDNLFDKAEAVIMESLRREHWQAFLESEQYAKMRNFLWFQDRPVVPDDFFTMRVLGRGGFGLVTGKKHEFVLDSS
jgi:hypothetical protein